jgi:hypothetical protein
MSLSDHISGLGRLPILRAISRMPFPAGAYRASGAGADLFPFAGPTALFSDAVTCRFRLRPARQDGGHNTSDLRAATFMCFTKEREAIICSLVNLERDIETIATSVLALS